jgi:hypothetical protein
MSTSPNNQATLCLREDGLHWQEIDDEIVALDGQESVYLAVRGSGTVLWRLLAESTTRDGLVHGLVEKYGIDSPRAAADVDAFLATLNERGLLAS